MLDAASHGFEGSGVRVAEGTQQHFIDYVLEAGLVSRREVEAALHEQRVTQDSIGRILVRNGFLPYRVMVDVLAAIDSPEISAERVTRSRIPVPYLRDYEILLAAETEAKIYVATAQDEDDVESVIHEFYPDKRIEFVGFDAEQFQDFVQRMAQMAMQNEDGGDVAQDEVMERLLLSALQKGASDIHILPRDRTYTVQFRLDGVKQHAHEGTHEEMTAVIAQIKDRSRMDLAERRVPQDGSFSIEYAGKAIDFRVATTPQRGGPEKVTIRILDPERVEPDLDGLGITNLKDWRRACSQRNGIILVCGETGSGKTTTLKATMAEVDRFENAVYTVEDPVEFEIPFATQVAINSNVGLTFASAVKNFMRSDPNVILIGEIRDEETARVAIRAAETGHLVFATLHTHSVVGVISRLKDLGVLPHELRGLLRGVLVQQLIRVKCKVCNGERPAVFACHVCGGTGYSGRTLATECLSFAIEEDVDRIIRLSKGEGLASDRRDWPSIFEDAILKMDQGVTDDVELRRLFGSQFEDFMAKRQRAVAPPHVPRPASLSSAAAPFVRSEPEVSDVDDDPIAQFVATATLDLKAEDRVITPSPKPVVVPVAPVAPSSPAPALAPAQVAKAVPPALPSAEPVKRPRGRPRLKPKPDPDLPKRPRGRPPAPKREG